MQVAWKVGILAFRTIGGYKDGSKLAVDGQNLLCTCSWKDEVVFIVSNELGEAHVFSFFSL